MDTGVAWPVGIGDWGTNTHMTQSLAAAVALSDTCPLSQTQESHVSYQKANCGRLTVNISEPLQVVAGVVFPGGRNSMRYGTVA